MNNLSIRIILVVIISLLFSGCVPDGKVYLAESSGGGGGGNKPRLYFSKFKQQMISLAIENGVSKAVATNALKYVTLDDSIIARQSKQPEFSTPVWKYIGVRVSPHKVSDGRRKIEQYKTLFRKLNERYGVDYGIIAAIYGIETNYGSYTGNKDVIRSLTTLAYSGKRRDYGRRQLIAALKIIQSGDVSHGDMTGSWAGAMGHTQFIPTTYLEYAVDYDNDSKRDIWNNVGDAMASTANYLKNSGWDKSIPWGYEVKLPRNFNYATLGYKNKHLVSFWSRKNIKTVDDKKLKHQTQMAGLFMPAGVKGPAFLVFNNFDVIMKYNNSTSYALAVGLLSDRLKYKRGVITSWPTNELQLTHAERKNLQHKLKKKGYNIGKVDGKIGILTKNAIKNYQRSVGIPPDGYPSRRLYKKLVMN